MLRARPIGRDEANVFVECLHRHHKPVVGYKFAIAAERDGLYEGVVIVGRPVSPAINPLYVTEVTRLVTTGAKNICSFLYAAAARTAKEMGYDRIQTYILEDEPGTSLRAAGWRFDGMTAGGSWDHGKRKGTRRTDQPTGPKQRWVKDLHTGAAA